MKLTPELVSKVKASVRGKKYSDLTKEEWKVLFSDNKNIISTVCGHNGIINDTVKPKDWKGGPWTGEDAMPKSMLNGK